MSVNYSQIGNTPSELFSETTGNEFSIDQFLSVEIVTTSQQSIPLTTTNMIPTARQFIRDVPVHDNVTRRQQGRRRRRQRQRQRRREQREAVRRQQVQQQQQQQSITQLIRHRRYETYQDGLWQQEEEDDRFNNIWEHSDPFEETMDEEFTEIQLEAYNLEKIDPKYRWEQEQLNTLEGFANLEQLALVQEEIEQLNQINDVQQMQEEKQKQKISKN